MTTVNAENVFVGIDVDEKTLKVHFLPSHKKFTVENSTDQCAALAKRLKKAGADLIVMEATGGVERKAAIAIASEDLNVVVANPQRTRDFARALGLLAKTDEIDALGLAKYAKKIKPEPTQTPSEDQQHLKDLAARRNQLIKMRTAEKNRIRRVTNKTVRRSIGKTLQHLNKQIEQIETEVEQRIQEKPRTRRLLDIITSVPGLGTQSACALIAQLPELGETNRQEIAALVGVAPYNWDSGKLRGERHIHGGRASLRRTLYMATLAVVRFNPVIKTFYKRLIEKGKKPKLALIAALRKTLTTINLMVRKNQTWQPKAT